MSSSQLMLQQLQAVCEKCTAKLSNLLKYHFQAVQQVITNLLVSHIELRSEDSTDIKPYTHERQVEKIVVKLGDELEFFKTKYLRVGSVIELRNMFKSVWFNAIMIFSGAAYCGESAV